MDSFLKACGAAGPLLLRIEGRAAVESQRCVLHQPFAIIGRDQRADLSLDGEQVSRRHAYLQMIAGTVFCVDLESRTGTYWEGQSRSFGWVYHDQVLRIGKHKIRLINPAEEGELEIVKSSNPFNPATQEIAIFPSAALEIRNGSASPVLWPLNRPLVLVGGALDCKIRLHGGGISRIHCSLVSTPRGVWVVDLRSPGGVYVNDKRVRFARLTNGDSFRVGSFTLRFCRRALPSTDQPVDVLEVEQPRGVGGWPDQSASAGKVTVRGNARASDSDWQVPEHREAASQDAGATSALVPAAPGSDARRPTHNDALVPLVQQFAQMQNQMFDQFQQTMMMMFQMFSALQKEHIALVREELNGIHELSREIKELQMEMLKHAPSGAPGGASAGEASSRDPSSKGKPTADHSQNEPQQSASAAAKAKPARTQPVSPEGRGQKGVEPDSPEARPEQGTAGFTVASTQTVTASGFTPSAHDPKANVADDVFADQPAKSSTPEAGVSAARSARPPADSPSADIHAWLCQRVASLQEERQTRWQKILSFFVKS